jgi:hypothetical protein
MYGIGVSIGIEEHTRWVYEQRKIPTLLYPSLLCESGQAWMINI